MSEIEQAIAERVDAVADPAEVGDPIYLDGLRAAVSAGVEYALSCLEAGDPEPTPVPLELLGQARAAARAAVPLDTVLRRYLAGHALIADFAIGEAEATDAITQTDLQRVLRTLSGLVDRLLVAASEEYRREAQPQGRSRERRRAEQVRRLLAGELVDASELGYRFEAWHLAAIAAGPAAEAGLRELAQAMGHNLLLVCCERDLAWAWLGGGEPLDPNRALASFAVGRSETALAVGEPAAGVDGWRYSHRQAAAALPVARAGPRRHLRYANVALLTSALRDELLTATLRRRYIEPLADERGGGEVLLATLRAYFAAERNVSSAAAALGVSRPTVRSRLATIEQRIGDPPEACGAELEIALRLEQLRAVAPPRDAK